ncbi:MAG: hypothetical protein AAGH57_00880 [Pseudomonadota bacterium]
MTFWPSAILSFVLGVLIWSVANVQGETFEPWDSADFGVFYIIACFVSFAVGLISEERAWFTGAIVVFSMLPVMFAFNPAIGPLFIIGLLFLAVLSVPTILSSVLGVAIRNIVTKKN